MDRHELIPPSSSTMQDPHNGRPNLQGKLRLKRSNTDSTQASSGSHTSKISFANEAPPQIHNKDQLCHKENCSSDPKDDDEDSLADFKSPKRDIVRKPILNKYKIEKTKRKTATKSSSSSKSRRINAKQPSIESSLLKTSNQPDLKEAVPCPVCLKPFKDDATCTNHMKSCAAKNNVSIKQLLEAKSLQDRQAQERKAIGLLAAPVLAEKKKAFRSKNFSNGDDPQLQLVLAMSESLYEAEKMVKLEEAALLAGFPVECVKEMSDEERRKTLQSFGFTTSKPIADPPAISRQRKKKLLAPTALQTRTKADKDRVLTERIACILTGDDALTQINATTVAEKKACTVINSQLLKRLEQTHSKLWDQSTLTKQSHNFYVDVLKPHFVKSAQQPVESQCHKPLMEDGDKPTITHMCDTSVLYDPVDLHIIMNNQQVEQTDNGQQQLNTNKSKCENLELEFMRNLSNNWKEALNDSSASDVLIFVKNNKYIYAHKLVFHVQCPNILLDIESMNAEIHPQIERKISWLDKEQASALAFLEFIYSGTICKYVYIFDKKELVQQVQQLARLYKVQDLFTYVRKKQRLLEHDEKGHVQGKEGGPSNKQFGAKKEIQAIPCEIQVTLDAIPSVHLKETSDELVAKKFITPKNSSTEHPIGRRITESPDLFDSDFEENEANVTNVKIKNNSDLENDGVIDEHLSSQKTLVNLSRSCSPVENIHEAVTPPSGRSPARGVELFGESSIFNREKIAEAVTPKCQSPNATPIKAVDVKQEAVDSAQDDLCNAVTPEHISIAEFNDHITPKKLVYTNMEVHDTASLPQMDVDESIHTAVTPPRLPEEKSVQTIDENALKIKSELTMFIERVQRINAKDVMETDSEADTPDNQARRKNPFSKREQDDSCKYLRNVGKQKYHKAISLLEKDVLNDEREKNELEEVEIDTSMKNAMDAKGDEITETDIDVTVDEAEMSMYSKYKLSAQDKHNSIAVYRKKLNFSGHSSCINESIIGNGASNAINSDTDSQTANKPKPKIIEDITLVSDSDEEPRRLRRLIRDKNKKKCHKTSTALVDATMMVNKKDTTVDVPTHRSNENNDIFPVDLVDDSREPNKNSMVLKLKKESTNKVIDLSVDSDEDDVNGDNTLPALDASPNKQISCPKQLQTSINRRMELEMAEKKSEVIDAEISKILQLSQEAIGDNVDHGSEKIDESVNRNTRDLDIDSSPISILSSRDPCLQLNQKRSQRLKNHASKDDSPENGENGGNGLLDFDNWDAKTPPTGKTVKSFKSFERPPEIRSPQNLLSTPAGPSKSEDDKMSVLISSPILSQSKQNSRASQGKSLKITSVSRNKRLSPDRHSEDVRKLKIKSASTSTLTEKTRKSDSLQQASSFVTPEKRSSNNQKDVTPSINFSLLDTPDLQKELKKFGLKPQSRTKAKALLTHIYKEAQSQKRTSSSNSSSGEDVPPAKRRYIRSDTKQPGAKNEKDSKTKKSCVIAEEMDFDDPDVANIFQNPVSIQDAFFKLIKTNRELYNQVLTYEPLPLESLHAMLKQSGFKCKINCLMDFLDEQCITFQVKTNKGDRTKKKP